MRWKYMLIALPLCAIVTAGCDDRLEDDYENDSWERAVPIPERLESIRNDEKTAFGDAPEGFAESNYLHGTAVDPVDDRPPMDGAGSPATGAPHPVPVDPDMVRERTARDQRFEPNPGEMVATDQVRCPAPQPGAEACRADQEQWALLAREEVCCHYDNPCAVPNRDWHTFSTRDACENSL